MGGTMPYIRFIGRHGLEGGYDWQTDLNSSAARKHGDRIMAGDLRRFERDMTDEAHVKAFARLSGATKAQVRVILKLLLEEDDVSW